MYINTSNNFLYFDKGTLIAEDNTGVDVVTSDTLFTLDTDHIHIVHDRYRKYIYGNLGITVKQTKNVCINCNECC